MTKFYTPTLCVEFNEEHYGDYEDDFTISFFEEEFNTSAEHVKEMIECLLSAYNEWGEQKIIVEENDGTQIETTNFEDTEYPCWQITTSQ